MVMGAVMAATRSADTERKLEWAGGDARRASRLQRWDGTTVVIQIEKLSHQQQGLLA